MIKRIKRRIHRAEEKLDRLLGSDKRAIPSPQASTVTNPAPIHANTSFQPLLKSALPYSDTIGNGLGSGLSPTPAQAMNQESSAISPNHELTRVESHSEQAWVIIPASQTRADSVPPLVENTSKLHTAWSGLRTLLSVLDKSADAFGPLKSAVGGLVACLEIYEGQVAAREEYQQLKIDLESASREIAGYLGGAAPPSMESSILKLAQDIKEEVKLVNRKTQRNTLERYAEATADADEILARYRRIQRHLDAFALSAGMKIWQIVDDHATRDRLKELPNSSAAKYSSAESRTLGRNECTPNTRVDVIEQLEVWAKHTESRRIYWLNGMAGTGKTTIAYTLCSKLERSGQLAASFFCSRQLPSCRNVELILPTIAYQLSMSLRPYRYELSGTLERNPDVHNQSVDKQLQYLIVAPLRSVRDKIRGDLVIVIDALDECKDTDSVGQILFALLVEVADLPVKIFLTSRPNPEILSQMKSKQGEKVQTELRLHELERSIVQSDVRAYLESALKNLEVTENELDKITEQSGVLFIYAATVVRYLKYDNFAWGRSRLIQIVSMPGRSSDAYRGVDLLYETILSDTLDDEAREGSETKLIRRILHTVICAQEPLRTVDIAGLLAYDIQLVDAALRPLRSVLQVSSTAKLVSTLHESFPDYLFDQKRSRRFHCDAGEYNALVAQTCFDLIQSIDPPFNVCGLESSNMALRQDHPGFDARVARMISGPLFYACRYWEAHAELAKPSKHLVDEVTFLLMMGKCLHDHVLG